MNDVVNELRRFLSRVNPGRVMKAEVATLEDLLAGAWDAFAIYGGGMEPGKLYGRMENVEWEDPQLSFQIERHGATARGSTRAELQTWLFDTSMMTGTCCDTRQRQLKNQQRRLDLVPLAKEVFEKILARAPDARLTWYSPDSAKVNIAAIIPSIGPKQTITGRRKRFREELGSMLEPHGWKKTRPNHYMRTGS